MDSQPHTADLLVRQMTDLRELLQRQQQQTAALRVKAWQVRMRWRMLREAHSVHPQLGDPAERQG